MRRVASRTGQAPPASRVAGGEFRPRVALRSVGVFFATGLGLSALYATTGVGLACPFRLVTGWDCPLCGGTRMGGALLHGDLAAAFAFNPLALVLVALLGVVGLCWLVEALGGPAVRPPLGVRRSWRRTTLTGRIVAVLVVAVGYTLLRNLV